MLVRSSTLATPHRRAADLTALHTPLPVVPTPLCRSIGVLLGLILGMCPALHATAADLVRRHVSPPTRMATFRFDGPDQTGLTALRKAALPHVGRPATTENLLRLLDDLASAAPVGGIDFEIRPSPPSARDREVRVLFNTSPTRIERFIVRERGAVHPEKAGEQTVRRMRATGIALHLGDGQIFHRYHLRLGRAALLDWYRARGHLDAEIDAKPQTEADLTTVRLDVTPGATFRARHVSVRGIDPLPAKTTRLGSRDRVSMDAVAADTERVRDHVCRQGFQHARVHAAMTREGADVDIAFEVEPGLATRVAEVEWTGETLSAELVEHALVKNAGPFCAKLADETALLIERHLRALGYYEARVDWHARPQDAEGSAWRVVFDVNQRHLTRVGRIWFRGHAVTREKILRQLISVSEGDLLRPKEVLRSVQNLRRSGLFRRVTADLVPGDNGGCRHLVFELVERDVVSVDFGSRVVTFHNMDLYWPQTLDEATDGVSLRGGGMALALRGQSDWVAARVEDPFLLTRMVATLEMSLRFHTFSALEEYALTIEGGAGVRALENQFQLIVLGFMRHTGLDAPSAYIDALPIPERGTAAYGAGFVTSLDLNDLDEERIAYLGADLDLRAVTTGPMPGLPLTEWSAGLAMNLPVYVTRRGQHGVLRGQVEGRWVAGAGLGPGWREASIFAHQRITPRARGYASDAIRQPYEVVDADGTETVHLGGLAAYTATVALRMPLPWRRNAIVAFLDAASLGDRNDSPWSDVYPSLGAAAEFSVFSERLEGTVYLAIPLRDEVEAEYAGVSAGGSFE